MRDASSGRSFPAVPTMWSKTMLTPDYVRVEKAIRYLDANYRSQPELRAIADEVGLSEFHFQRLFAAGRGSAQNAFCST